MSLRVSASIALLAASVAAAEAEPQLRDNAALKYWQASALLPKDAVEKAERVRVRPQGPEAAAFVQECSNSLRLLREGAAIRRCDWGLNPDEGPALLLPHMSKMRQLARVGCAAACVDFERKKHADAVARAFDVLTLSRHVGADGLLIGKLVEVAIANMATEVLASYLPALPPETLQTLSARLAKLPLSATFADAIRMEQRTFGDWFRKRMAATPPAERAKLVNALMGEGAGAEDATSLQAAVADDAKLAEALSSLDQHYAALIAAASAPAAEQKPLLAQLQAKLKTANPLVRLCLPGVTGCQQSVAAHETRMLMLRAAADVVVGGPDAVAKHKDPYGDGPFGYRKLEVGFELSSALTGRDGAPVKLNVGAPLPVPAPARDEAVFPPRPPPEQPGDF